MKISRIRNQSFHFNNNNNLKIDFDNNLKIVFFYPSATKSITENTTTSAKISTKLARNLTVEKKPESDEITVDQSKTQVNKNHKTSMS